MLKKALPFLTLLSSVSTLLCCALPALLVTLGLGATVVSLFSALPQLIWLSERKLLVFGVAGALLILSASLRKLGERAACPIDAELAAYCKRWKRADGIILYFAVACYLVGAFFAFVAPVVFS
ncbi:MAG: hypothetical protein NTV65_11325 [Proteobacteria bacterium]|nr:hypothetical protein [Pseudomonadota bacterium]